VPCPFGALLGTLDHFLAQTFFLGGTSPQRPRPVGRRSRCPSYPSETLYGKFGITPPTPSTLSPLFKGGEGRGEGGSYTPVLCPFGALLVTLDHFLAQTFFLGGTSPQRPRPVGRRSRCPSYPSETLYGKFGITPPTPYTLSPLFKGGEGRGEGGSYTPVLCPFGALLGTLDHFLAQTFFLGGTSPQRPRPVGRRSRCPSYPSETLYGKFGITPPTPYTLSPLFKGGEGRGEGGSYTPVLCPFGALLVTLDHFLAQTFFLGGTSPQRPRPVGGAQDVPLTLRKPSTENLVLHPPLPTPSPPFSRGERVGVRGDRTLMCRAPSGPSSGPYTEFLAKGF
jgi:hypothetical protein